MPQRKMKRRYLKNQQIFQVPIISNKIVEVASKNYNGYEIQNFNNLILAQINLACMLSHYTVNCIHSILISNMVQCEKSCIFIPVFLRKCKSNNFLLLHK